MKRKNYNIRLSEPLIKVVTAFKRRNLCETDSEAIRRIIAEHAEYDSKNTLSVSKSEAGDT